jgi:uncharacterized protein YeaO (DUF488 family)
VPSQFRIRRVYHAPSPSDGARVLVDRIWPRGLRKDAAHLDEWAKDAAPSTELRKWYGHDPAKFDEFRRRYLDELSGAAQRKELGRIRALAAAGPVTLLTATRDVELSQAAVLAQVLGQDVESDQGGDAACWAHLACPECGAVQSEGHRPGCGAAVRLPEGAGRGDRAADDQGVDLAVRSELAITARHTDQGAARKASTTGASSAASVTSPR